MCHIVKVVKRSQRLLADQVALAFANKQPFDILANDGTTINMPANTAAAQMKAAYPYPGRRDRLSHYAPRCRDIVLWVPTPRHPCPTTLGGSTIQRTAMS